MNQLVVFLLFLTIIVKDAIGNLDETNKEEALRSSLMSSYDKQVRPGGLTTISLRSLRILNFEMNEADHSMELLTFFGYKWDDKRLKWNKEDYGNISHIAVDPTTVWTPDLSVYNSAVGPNTKLKSDLPLIVYSTGNILFIPVINFHFSCIMDLTYWPHDTQNCTVKLGSWVHDGFTLDYNITDVHIEKDFESKDMSNGQKLSISEWDLLDEKVKKNLIFYDCCPEPYVDITISIGAVRKAHAYYWTAQMPATCLSILTLVIFLLPPGAGEKVVFGGLCLILDFLFINYTSRTIDHAPSHTPLIVELVCQQVILIMVSLIVSALIIRMAKAPRSSGLYPSIKITVIRLASLLCLGNYADLASGTIGVRNLKPDEVELGDGSDNELGTRERSDRNEWLVLSAVLDRLFFLLYLTICIITLIRFSSVI